MPQPSAGQLHVDQLLTNISVSWAQDQANFVADKIFPAVQVNKESDLYAIYEKGYFYRDELAARPLGGRPQQTGYEVKTGRYACTEWALEHLVDDRVRTNADQPFDVDMAAMRLLTTKAMIRRDNLWTSQFFTTGLWGVDWVGNTSATADGAAGTPNTFLQFDQSGSDPIGFFDQRRLAIAGNTGYAPNVLVLGTGAYRVLKNHPSVTDRIKYTQRGIVTPDILAELFDVERVVIPMGVQNTAHEGQVDSIGYIVDPLSAMLVYAAPAPSLNSPSAGYTFAYTGLLPGYTNAFGGVIERGREELAHSDVFQIRAAYDQRIVASELGEFFLQCVSPAAAPVGI